MDSWTNASSKGIVASFRHALCKGLTAAATVADALTAASSGTTTTLPNRL